MAAAFEAPAALAAAGPAGPAGAAGAAGAAGPAGRVDPPLAASEAAPGPARSLRTAHASAARRAAGRRGRAAARVAGCWRRAGGRGAGSSGLAGEAPAAAAGSQGREAGPRRAFGREVRRPFEAGVGRGANQVIPGDTSGCVISCWYPSFFSPVLPCDLFSFVFFPPSDLIVQAKSGTGKTCVFSTIALDSLVLENQSTQILILAPTREIAVQIHSVITAIGIKMEGLECHVFIGGTPLSQDKTRLKKCHIAVGSPGRIKQLIELDYLNPGSIRLFILDEADKLLEEGSFQEQINWIYSSLPASKQMLAVSATYPEFLANALTKYMRDPTFVRLNSSDPSLIGLKQYYKIVNSYPLAHKIFEEKAQHLQELFSRIPFNQALVFSNLHSRAQHLADILSAKGFPAECISGNVLT
uniref:Helicase ATP-binding domain-containing protein n=1 Tax=Canis lupus familiaris TaxID=9615 RepID=A0A8P0PKG2_CANLF